MSPVLHQNSKLKRVILCADDFGLTAAACESIVNLAGTNAISATSCAVDGQFFEQYASALISVSAHVSLGLHVNLTENPSDARYQSLQSWLARCFVLRTADKNWLAKILALQLDRFEAVFKRAPDFIDGHEHVHQFPIVRDVLLELLRTRYVAPMAVRSTVPRIWRGAKASIIARLGGTAMRRMLLSNRLAANADFAGVYNFTSDVAFASRMRSWLASIADRGLIMCHPELSGQSSGVRSHEHSFLASNAWTEMRRDCNVALIPFSFSTLTA